MALPYKAYGLIVASIRRHGRRSIMRAPSKKRWTIVIAAAAGFALVGSQVATAGGASPQPADVFEFDGGAVVGHASLTRGQNGVKLKVTTQVSGQLDNFGDLLGVDWTTGDASTVWFVVFNNPDECDDGCGEDEVLKAAGELEDPGNNAAGVGVHFGNGHVAGGEGFHSAARLKEGDMSGLLFGMGLKDAMTAEVHAVLRSHGPADELTGQQLSAALHSVDGGCEVNICGDAQAAIFKP
jgi:hypothetical protein